MTDTEELAQSLQDHLEQHHGICLQASQWDAVATYITREIDAARAAGAAAMQERAAQLAERHNAATAVIATKIRSLTC